MASPRSPGEDGKPMSRGRRLSSGDELRKPKQNPLDIGLTKSSSVNNWLDDQLKKEQNRVTH